MSTLVVLLALRVTRFQKLKISQIVETDIGYELILQIQVNFCYFKL